MKVIVMALVTLMVATAIVAGSAVPEPVAGEDVVADLVERVSELESKVSILEVRVNALTKRLSEEVMERRPRIVHQAPEKNTTAPPNLSETELAAWKLARSAVQSRVQMRAKRGEPGWSLVLDATPNPRDMTRTPTGDYVFIIRGHYPSGTPGEIFGVTVIKYPTELRVEEVYELGRPVDEPGYKVTEKELIRKYLERRGIGGGS